MKKIIVFGIGYMFNVLSQKGVFKDCEILACCDNNSDFWEQEIDGIEIISPSRINEFIYDEIWVTTPRYEKVIRQQLVEQYGIEDAIIKLAEPKKRDEELLYWSNRFAAEGQMFSNAHYKELMLSIAEEENDSFLTNKVVADFGCGPRGSLNWIKTPCITDLTDRPHR